MRTFSVRLRVDTDKPWQHRDVPASAQVIGVFASIDAETVEVHYQHQDTASREETEAFVIVGERGGHHLPLGFDPRHDPRERTGNTLEHVGSCEDRGGVVRHVYRRV